MENVIIIGLLVLVVIIAVLRAMKHFKGGGCCGSGSNTLRSKKTLDGDKKGEKTLIIEGMHCENCAIRVENAINRLDGVVCRVNLKKKSAQVSYSQEPSVEELRRIVEKLDYQVTEIR